MNFSVELSYAENIFIGSGHGLTHNQVQLTNLNVTSGRLWLSAGVVVLPVSEPEAFFSAGCSDRRTFRPAVAGTATATVAATNSR